MDNNTPKIRIENKNEKTEEYYLKWLDIEKDELITVIKELIKQLKPDETKEYTIKNLRITPTWMLNKTYYDENHKLEGYVTDGEKAWAIELSFDSHEKKLKISGRREEKDEIITTERFYTYENHNQPQIMLKSKKTYKNCLDFMGMYLINKGPNTYVTNHQKYNFRMGINSRREGMTPATNDLFEVLKDDFRYTITVRDESHNKNDELNIEEATEEQIIKEMLTINDNNDPISVIKNVITILNNIKDKEHTIKLIMNNNPRDYENVRVEIYIDVSSGKILVEIDLPCGRKYSYKSEKREEDLEATLETIRNEISQIIKIIEKSKKRTRKK